MKVGDKAEVTRTFSARDLHDYGELSGHIIKDDYVPEPLVGALFSYLLGMELPGMGAMYLKQQTHFVNKALIGEALTAQVEITRLRPKLHLADLETSCRRVDGQLIATGRALVYVGDVKPQPANGIDQFPGRS